MTDSRRLLEEYVRNGSEAAFRELVTGYVDLVFSAALRLVGGDTHLAEDIVQSVFVDLARTGKLDLTHGIVRTVPLDPAPRTVSWIVSKNSATTCAW